MTNKILMNKRFSFDDFFSVILFFGLLVAALMLSKAPVFDFDQMSVVMVIGVLYFLLFIYACYGGIKNIIRLSRLPRCKAVEMTGDEFIIYGYRPTSGSYIKHRIDISDIKSYEVSFAGSFRHPDYLYMNIFTNQKTIRIKNLTRRVCKKFDSNMNYPIVEIKKLLNRMFKEKGIYETLLPDKAQNQYAKLMFTNYLSAQLAHKPLSVKFAGSHWIRAHGQRVYIFKFKRTSADQRYLIGMNGGYIDSKSRDHQFSATKFAPYNKKTTAMAVKALIKDDYNDSKSKEKINPDV